MVRHCSRCTERCNEIAKTFGTKEEIEAANDMDLVLCAGKCGRGFHRQCLQDHEIFQVAEEAMWTCMDCRTNVHECFVCGVKGLLRGHEEIKIGNEIEEMAEEKIRRRSRRREKRKKVERKIAFVRSLDNETPRQISRKLKIDLKTLVAMNRLKYPGLHANARLMQDTELELPHTGLNGFWMGRYDVEQCNTCGRFFHPSCLNLPDNTTMCCSNQCQSKICCSENNDNVELVRCVKCPAAYHVGCLPFDKGIIRLSVNAFICAHHPKMKHLAKRSLQVAEFAKTTMRRTQRSRRCHKCENCLNQDCGRCKNCLDMPKFGGKGRRQRACIKRNCINLTLPFRGFCVCASLNTNQGDDDWIACVKCEQYVVFEREAREFLITSHFHVSIT